MNVLFEYEVYPKLLYGYSYTASYCVIIGYRCMSMVVIYDYSIDY